MTEYDINGIMSLIPHRYPFLLIDRVTGGERGETCTAMKNVTVNEPFFPGHFPQEPVMPGVLILEALAQTAGILAMDFLGEDAHGRALYFMGIDGAKFRRKVVPGDTLRFEVKKDRGGLGAKVWRFSGQAFVGDVKACECSLTAMIGEA